MRAAWFLARSSISPAERRWVLGFAGLVLLLTSLPYLIGYEVQGLAQGSAQSQAYRFTGFVFGLEDGNSYIAKMLSGTFGDWLFRSPYSAMPQTGVFLFPLHIGLGKLAAPPGLHEQLVALYQLFRLAAGLLLILATYDFLAFFIGEVRWRRFGLALATLGGGLGWFSVVLGRPIWLGSLPLDIYSPETFGFLEIYGLPHLALARAGMLWTLLAYLRLAAEAEAAPGPFRWGRVVHLGLLWLLVTGLAQPLTVAVTGAVIAAHLAVLAVLKLWKSRQGIKPARQGWLRLVAQVAAAGLLPGLLLAYTFWISLVDPYVKAWTVQNRILSPHPLHYLFAYGLIVPYAVVGAARLLRRQTVPAWLLIGWIFLFPFLVYIPLNLQRRLAEGLWVAWTVLAMAALDRSENPAGASSEGGAISPADRVGEKPISTRKALGVVLPLFLSFLTAVLLLMGGSMAAARPGLPLFRPADEVRTFEVLQTPSQKGAVVLAAFDTSNALPAWAPLHVVIGHGPESVGLAQLQPQVEAFYRSATSDAQRLALIDQQHVQYVFWGPAERALGDWSPQSAGFLRPLAQFGEYSLFEVLPSP